MTIAALLLFDGCDVMDVTGPYEVLLTANRLASRWVVDVPFQVRTVSLDGRSVVAYGGLGLTPSHGALHDNHDAHQLIVPGLIDLEAGLGNRALLDGIARAGAHVDRVASVCTGAFLLDAAGLLGDGEATTHWEDVPALAERRGRGVTRDDVRWAVDGDVVTSGGLSSGIAMALHLVEQVAGRPLAEATATQIDYVWTRERG